MYLMCFFQVLPHSNIPTPSDDLPPSTPSSATDNRNFQFTDHNSNKEVSQRGMLGNGQKASQNGKWAKGQSEWKKVLNPEEKDGKSVSIPDGKDWRCPLIPEGNDGKWASRPEENSEKWASQPKGYARKWA